MRLNRKFETEIICTGESSEDSFLGKIPLHVLRGHIDGYCYANGVMDILKRLQPSIIYAHNYSTYMPYLAHRARCTIRGTKFVLHSHFHPYGASTMKTIVRRIYDPAVGSRILKSADAIISNSDVERRLLEERFPQSVKAHVIYNGINLEKITSAKLLSMPKEGTSLLFVGRFEAYKHADIAIRVTKRLADSYHLYLIGGGPEEARLRQLASRLECEDRVHFLGYLSETEVYGWYKFADLYIHPSESESFGMTCIEALAAGTPSIANQDGFGLSETISLFPEFIHPIDIRRQTIESLSATVEGLTKVKKSVAADLSSFDWNHLATKLIGVVESLSPS
jgi:glycosyltransferase involved in cell wall biosynthesis